MNLRMKESGKQEQRQKIRRLKQYSESNKKGQKAKIEQRQLVAWQNANTEKSMGNAGMENDGFLLVK